VENTIVGLGSTTPKEWHKVIFSQTGTMAFVITMLKAQFP